MPRPVRKTSDFERWVEALLSPEWETRLNATEALGKMKDKRAVKPLLAALKDEDEYVREGAAWAPWSDTGPKRGSRPDRCHKGQRQVRA